MYLGLGKTIFELSFIFQIAVFSCCEPKLILRFQTEFAVGAELHTIILGMRSSDLWSAVQVLSPPTVVPILGTTSSWTAWPTPTALVALYCVWECQILTTRLATRRVAEHDRRIGNGKFRTYQNSTE